MGQWATWWRPPAEAALMPRPPFASAEAEADQLLLGGLDLGEGVAEQFCVVVGSPWNQVREVS